MDVKKNISYLFFCLYLWCDVPVMFTVHGHLLVPEHISLLFLQHTDIRSVVAMSWLEYFKLTCLTCNIPLLLQTVCHCTSASGASQCPAPLPLPPPHPTPSSSYPTNNHHSKLVGTWKAKWMWQIYIYFQHPISYTPVLFPSYLWHNDAVNRIRRGRN